MLVPWRVNDSFSCSQSYSENPAQKPCRCRACDLPGRKSFRLWLHQPETKGSNHRSGTPIWGRGGMVGFMKCRSLHWTYNMTLKNAFTYCWWKQIPVANGGISHYCCGFRISQVGWPVIHGLALPKKTHECLASSKSNHHFKPQFLWKKHEPSVLTEKTSITLTNPSSATVNIMLL